MNNLVKSTKGNYNKKLLLESVNRPEKFWKSIKRVFPSKQQNGTSTSFNINGAEISNKKSIADNFCLFFTNVAETLKSKSILLKDFIWSYPETFQRRTDAVFKFKPVLVADVFKYLKQLKSGFLKDTAKSRD